jgi:hypothetical protein
LVEGRERGKRPSRQQFPQSISFESVDRSRDVLILSYTLCSPVKITLKRCRPRRPGISPLSRSSRSLPCFYIYLPTMSAPIPTTAASVVAALVRLGESPLLLPTSPILFSRSRLSRTSNSSTETSTAQRNSGRSVYTHRLSFPRPFSPPCLVSSCFPSSFRRSLTLFSVNHSLEEDEASSADRSSLKQPGRPYRV